MSFIFIVILRTRKRLTPKDVAAVKELKHRCAQVVAPTLQSGACREQAVSAARAVATAVERLVAAAPAPAAAAHGLPEAARRVTDELDRLLAHCTAGLTAFYEIWQLMSSLLGHRPSLWIVHKENGL
jgi:hypothetical protein